MCPKFFSSPSRGVFLLLLLFFAVGFGQTQRLDIMPYPKKVELQKGKFRLGPAFHVSIFADPEDQLIESVTNRFIRRLMARTQGAVNGNPIAQNRALSNTALIIRIDKGVEPAIGNDESYALEITPESIELSAPTTTGGLWGLETLLQLVARDEEGFYLPALALRDTPRFQWRGSMVDVARHFIPVKILKRHIDAMSIVKMNILHLHLSDDEGFRVESKLYPELHRKGSRGRFYTQNELVSLVAYAKERGIIIVPEFDMPGHTRSWFAGYPELASQPGPYEPGVRYQFEADMERQEMIQAIMSGPTPTLDPSREEVYEFLDNLLGEMAQLFPSPYMHIGADENNGAAWNSNPKIAAFMKEHGMEDAHALHHYFVGRVYELVKKHRKRMIGWEEAYSEELAGDIILQAWITEDSFMKAINPVEVAEKGYSLILSTGFYLDLFMPSAYHYKNTYLEKAEHDHLLGGEAPLWAELIDEYSFEGRAWPRTASVAERLWSAKEQTDINDMYRRLYRLSDWLEASGLDHRLNRYRALNRIADGKASAESAEILELLAPVQGYARLGLKMFQPAELQNEWLPFVSLADVAPIDSESEWRFQQEVKRYIEKKSPESKEALTLMLISWKEAAQAVMKVTEPLGKQEILRSFAADLETVSVGALAYLGATNTPYEGADYLQKINQLKGHREFLQLRILDEVEALVTDNTEPIKF